jgi:hypothetical protein
MTTSSSSTPLLGPVLFFTSTDGYSYDVDNRPILNLDTNIRHINTSLVGIGYGEHASQAGGLLSPGRAVLLNSNGSVYYPVTGGPDPKKPLKNIIGLVIGATDSGLNRVIWSSKHLDLDVLGLSSITSGAESGMYLVTSVGANGIITATATPNTTNNYILGRVKNGPYIEINTSTDLISNDTITNIGNASKDNHANLYGFTRFRNLLNFIDAGSIPVQYSKHTIYQSDFSDSTINPMNAKLSTGMDSISAGDPDTTNYGNTLRNMVIKERYTRFLTSNTSSDVISCNSVPSSWAASSYSTSLPSNSSENYELQQMVIGSSTGKDYSQNIDLFKTFNVDKYYQYARVASSDTANPLKGKVLATATVFNPLQVADQGGEMSSFIVWDFYSYNTSGYESYKHRVILTGESAAQALLSSSGIFPSALVTFA